MHSSVVLGVVWQGVGKMIAPLFAEKVPRRIREIINHDVRIDLPNGAVHRPEGPPKISVISPNALSRCVTHVIREIILDNLVGKLAVPFPVGILEISLGFHVVGSDAWCT